MMLEHNIYMYILMENKYAPDLGPKGHILPINSKTG